MGYSLQERRKDSSVTVHAVIEWQRSDWFSCSVFSAIFLDIYEIGFCHKARGHCMGFFGDNVSDMKCMPFFHKKAVRGCLIVDCFKSKIYVHVVIEYADFLL